MKTQLVFQEKIEKLSSLPIKNQENKDFNKPSGRLVFCIFDKYMIIRTNYMSGNNFPVM
jgi:predicted solute-binding protein